MPARSTPKWQVYRPDWRGGAVDTLTLPIASTSLGMRCPGLVASQAVWSPYLLPTVQGFQDRGLRQATWQLASQPHEYHSQRVITESCGPVSLLLLLKPSDPHSRAPTAKLGCPIQRIPAARLGPLDARIGGLQPRDERSRHTPASVCLSSRR